MSQKEYENIKLLKQYKELLDIGAISQEEYDDKKRRLLNDEVPTMEIQHNIIKESDAVIGKKRPKKKKGMGCLISILISLIILLFFVSLIIVFSEEETPEMQESSIVIESSIPVFYIDLAHSYSDYIDKVVETTIPADYFNSSGSISTNSDMLANRISVVTDDESYSQKSSEIKYITVSGKVSFEYGEVRITDCTILDSGIEPPEAYVEKLAEYKEMVILGKMVEREAFLNSSESKSYEDLKRNPDSNKDKALKLEVSIVDVEPDGLFSNGVVEAKCQGKTIYIYDERENREPRLASGEKLTIYATGRDLIKVKTFETGTGIFGSNLGANVVEETEEVAVTMLYTDKEDISKYDVTSRDEYAYYLLGVESSSSYSETNP